MAITHDFTEFTRTRYRQLLKLGRQHYRFIHFGDPVPPGHCVWWRHDVDVSPHAALKLAAIEAEESCEATYFVCLRSPFYNLFEPAVARRIRAILDLGHRLGVHFDMSSYDLTTDAELEAALERERAIIAGLFGATLGAFSFHNPGPLTDGFRRDSYAGLVNVYSDYFRSNVGYVSDSNGYWRYRALDDVLERALDARLQVLTHPVWWQETPMSPRDRIARSVRGRAEATLSDYDRTLERAGRPNIRD